MNSTDTTMRMVAAGAFFTLLLALGIVADVLLLARGRRRHPDTEGMVRALRARPWTWESVALTALLILTLNSFVILIASLVDRCGWICEQRLSPALMFIQASVFPVVIVLAVRSFLKARSITLRQAFGIERAGVPRRVARGILFYVAAMPAVALCSLVYVHLLNALGFPFEKQPVILLVADPAQPLWLRIYLGMLAIAVAPVVEEVFFRGMLLPVLARLARPALAVTACSLFFAAIHFHVPSVAALFVIASAFALGYIVTGSLTVAIAMHAAFNTVSLAVILLIKDTPLFHSLP